MLSPNSRQTLLDALRPPAGFRLGCAVGTTFSLNLDAALIAPAAFALYAVTDLNEARAFEPLELLDSIRRHAGKFTVFFQAGQAAVPTQRRLFAFLEGAVIAVTAPNGGVFHPKVWVLRFDSDSSVPAYRMLCASRNLTYDRSWDTMLRLDSVDDAESSLDTAPAIDPTGLSEFVRALPTRAVGAVDPKRVTDITELADQLATIRWSPPAGVQSGRFLPIGLSNSTLPPFPAAVDRLAVISPFLSAGLLNHLPHSDGRRVLVSRPDQIAEYQGTVRDRFPEVFTLDPDAIPSGAAEDGPSGESDTQVPADDPAIPFDGLHAKLYVFDNGNEATVLTGSANATSAAFGRNVEFLTELKGARSALGVEALLAAPAKDNQTLLGFLIPFALDGVAQDVTVGDAAEDRLDVLRRQVAAMGFKARARPDGPADWFALEFTTSAVIPHLPEGLVWRCWPINSSTESAHTVDHSKAFNQTFRVSFEGITAFLANELTFENVSTRFVLAASLEEAPENRTTRLLRILLGDTERLLRYLLMMLADDVSDQYGFGDAFDALEHPESGWRIAVKSLPLLEALLRALSKDPSRLDRVQSLIADLQSDSEDETLLPAGLVEIWEPIWAAAKDLGQ